MKTFNKWIALREQGAPGGGVGGAAPTGAGGPGGIAPAQTAPGAIPQTPNQAGGLAAKAIQTAPNPADAPSWTSPQFYVEFHRQKPLPNQIGLFKQELDKYLQAVHKQSALDLGQVGTTGGKVTVTPKGKMGEEVNPFVWAEIERAGNILAGTSTAAT